MNTIKEICLAFFIFFFLLISIEIGLSLFFSSKDEDYLYLDRRSAADTYADSSWTEDYFKELKESRLGIRWKPYAYWQRDSYDGQYVNVAEDGLRFVPNTATEAAETVSIYLFGGSTMWGTGARDQFAIPSILAQELGKKGIDAHVRNFGETGYVSAQELAALTDQLRHGEIPDVVIFYDGINDTFSAYQQGKAGLPQNEFRRASEFNLISPKRRQDLVKEAVEASSTMRFLRGFIATIGSGDQTTFDGQNNDLARDVVTSYANNIKMVEALAETYGFKALFYWQPTIFDKAVLTAYEQGEFDRIKPKHKSFFEMTYDLINSEGETFHANSSFHDLSEIFSETKEPIYIDWMHLGEQGNAVIAQRMADDTSRLIETLPQINEGDAVEHSSNLLR